jgi:predicted PurR-regulated permease PerM
MPAHQQAPDRGTLQRWTFLILLIGIAYLFWTLARPLWVPIFLGALIAIGLHPVHKAFVQKLKKWEQKEAVSAGVLTVGVLIAGSALLTLFSVGVLRQILAMVRTFADQLRHRSASELLSPRITELLGAIGENPEHLQQKLLDASGSIATSLGADATRLLAASFGAVVTVILTVITAYYLLRNGERFTSWFVAILPLPDGEVWELVRNFRDVARVMLLGTGVTSFYQGAISSLGYLVCGVPHPLVWGAATAVASILPALGTTIVWGPLFVWLLIKGRAAMGILLLFWSGLLTLGVADYLLRPKLLGNKVKLNELVIFIALFGGLETFGLLGTILGPIIAALLVAMLRIYQRDYRPRPARAQPQLVQSE